MEPAKEIEEKITNALKAIAPQLSDAYIYGLPFDARCLLLIQLAVYYSNKINKYPQLFK
jgi:hypothetical protein